MTQSESYRAECPYDDADECAMARERQVAGTDEPIPACPVHGEHPDVDPTACECGHAAHAHPYQSGPGMTWFDGCLAAGCECSSYRGTAVEPTA